MTITTILIYLLIIIISVIFYYIKKNLNYWQKLDIPHEKPHFIMGNLKGARTKYNVGEIFAEYYKKFKGSGPFAGIHIVHRPGVVVLDTSLIKNVLIKDFNNFADRGLYYNEESDPLTGHLFLLDGEKWKILRNKLSPTFSSGKMKFMYSTLLQVVDTFMEVLKENVAQNNIIEIHDMLGRFTTDTISSCAFGIECNSLRNPNSEFPKFGRKSFVNTRHNAFIMALIDGFPNLARKLGMRIVPEDVHQFFMRTITDTINYREQHKIQRNDFLNLLLDIKNNNTTGLGDLSMEEMCAQVFVFFLGGFETSSSTVTYAIYELAQHQDLQERLRQEVNEFFENNNDGSLTYEDLKNMLYLDQVLKETLRRYPVVTQLSRKALNDYVVPGHPKYVIKKDMPVLIPVLGLHHDPEIYPNPLEFDPERFALEVAKQRDSMFYLPFGDGPRNCIGERFGQMQSRLALAYLIRNFQFYTCAKTEIPLEFDPRGFSYIPKNKVYLRLEEIFLANSYKQNAIVVEEVSKPAKKNTKVCAAICSIVKPWERSIPLDSLAKSSFLAFNSIIKSIKSLQRTVEESELKLKIVKNEIKAKFIESIKMFITLVLLTVILGLLSYCVWWYNKRLNYWFELGIPCEKPHWLMGNFKGLMTETNFHDICHKYYMKFKGTGPFAGFYFATKPTVMVLDPKLIQHILIKDFSNFTDHGFYYNEEDDPLSGQLFLLDGLKWKNMRNKLSPTFTSGKMKQMFPTILDIAQEFISVMAQETERNNNIIEIKDLAGRFTTDVIGTCGFGIECNSLQNPNTEFRIMGKKAVKEQRHGLLVNGLMQSFPELARKLHMKQFPEDVEKFYFNLVKQTVEYRENNNVQRNDLMATLIDLKNKKLIQAEHGEELTNLTLNQVMAQAFVFFNAGFETSSTTMSFALYELAKNPEIQEKARLEIDEVLENYQQKFTYESMKDMKYLHQIISETLRLYTILPIISRMALNDYVVPGHSNYVIKKGMNISIPACAIHRDQDYYSQPDKFNPDHFAEDVVAQRESCVYLPFGEGPRNCIGMRFGKMQTIAGLVMLLRNFKFSVCDQTEILLTYDKKSFMLSSEKGIYLKVTKI
ncbi:uncharacterized protein ACRADG_010944 [Cochliomyia hominivorax]